MSEPNRPLTEQEQSVVRHLEKSDPDRAAEYLKNLAFLDEHIKLPPELAPKPSSALGKYALIAGLVVIAGLIGVGLHDWRSPEQKTADAARARQARIDKIIEDVRASPEPSSLGRSQAEDVVKVAINVSGNLCADIVSATPLPGNKARVTCIALIGGTDRVTYIVDVSTGATVKE